MYCWIKKKKLYDVNDIQSMLEFLRAKAELKEYRLFQNYINRLSLSDANAIREVIAECWAERFDRYDSDVAEQFIRIFDIVFLSDAYYTPYKPTARFVAVGYKSMEDCKKWWILDTTDWTVEACSERQLFDLIVVHKEPIDGVELIDCLNGSKRLKVTVR